MLSVMEQNVNPLLTITHCTLWSAGQHCPYVAFSLVELRLEIHFLTAANVFILLHSQAFITFSVPSLRTELSLPVQPGTH